MTLTLRSLLPQAQGCLVLLLLLLLGHSSGAQTWESAQAIGTSDYNGQASGSRTISDGAGHLYVTGSFQGTISLGGRTLQSEAYTSFLAQLDADSGQCRWALTTAAGVQNLAVDASGTLTVAGSFIGRSLTLGSTTLTNTCANPYGSDLFVAKLSSSGQWLGAYQASGPGSKHITHIDLDASGNAYLAGSFGAGATFGSTTLTSTGSGIFVAKLSATGQWQWAVTGGSEKNNYTNGLRVDANGNAYVTGQFYGATATFGGFTLTNTSNVAGSGSAEVFVAKLSATGQWQWATRGGGYDNDNVSGLGLDASGNVYVAGSFRGYSTSFGTTTLNNNSGEYNGFVAKLSTAGQWQWASQITGNGNEIVNDLAVDATGAIYLAGTTSSSRATFGSIELTTTAQGPSSLITYAARLTSSGQWQWATPSGGPGNTSCASLALDAANHVFLTGDYQGGNVVFGATTLRSSGAADLFVTRLSTAGQWQWAMNSNGGGKSTVSSTAVDATGNVYIAGSFTGSLTFGSTTLVSTTSDLFVAKRSAAGQWLWLAQAAGTARYPMGYYNDKHSLALDAAGNVYVTGSFGGAAATFGATTLSSVAGGNAGYDVFVAKLNANGQWQWATQAGGNHDDYSGGIAVDAGANVYVTGSFQSATLSCGTTTLTNPGGAGSPEIFAAKLSTSGQWLWATQAGGPGSEYGSDLALDAAGNAYVTGVFQNTTASFGSLTLTSPNLGYGSNAYVAKLSTAGQWQWATPGGSGYAGASGIAADAAGNTYVTGFFGGRADFGSLTLTSTDSSDVFVGKLTPAGQWQWVAQGGLRGANFGSDIAVDATGSAYVTGGFRSAGAIFGATTLPFSRRSYHDTFVARLTPTGQWQWATSSGGTNSTYSLALGGNGGIYVGGEFSGNYGDARATFGPHTLTTPGRVHSVGYLARLVGTVTASRAPINVVALAQAVPNPFATTLSVQFVALQPGQLALTAHDATGRQWLHRQVVVKAQQSVLELPEAAKWPAGVYLLMVRQGRNQQVLKVVRQ